MGHFFCVGPCLCCGSVFSYNSVSVPSAAPNTRSDRVEPICRDCIGNHINPKRIKDGLPPVIPEPDAYGVK